MGKKRLPFIKGRAIVGLNRHIQVHQDRRTKRLRSRSAQRDNAIKDQREEKG